MFRVTGYRIVLVVAALGAAATRVAADDFEVAAQIDQVTVFAYGAEVTRTGSVSLPAGEHRLLLSGLPSYINAQRLRLQLGDETIRLGSLQLQEEFEVDLVSEEEQRLQAELNALLLDRQAISDEIESANTQLKLLDSLASGALGGDQASLAAADLAALLDTLASSSNASRQVIREAGQRRQALDGEIAQKRAQLDQVATRRRSQQLLTVSVQNDNATTTDLSITYPVNEAGWGWVYEARLDSAARALELQRKVAVTQTTGEDWSDVSLNITTARPGENTATPQLGSLLVDIYQPPVALARARGDLAFEAPAIEEVVVSAAIRNYADVVASQYLVDFRIPGRVSVAADSQPRVLPIDQRLIPVDLVTRVVPEVEDTAYLEARFIYEDSVPLQAGEMQLYRDGAFIGSRFVSSFLPQEEASLPFGRDERVRVETIAEQQESREGGTFRRSAVEDHRVSYVLTSFHDRPIDLEVLVRLPVSQNQAIEVEVAPDATPFDEVDVNDQTGVALWRRQAQPAQTIELHHYYSVSYPRDETLDYRSN